MVAAELDGRNWLVGYDEGLKFKHTPDVVEELLCSFQKGIKLPKTASISVHAFALLHQHSLLEHPPER
jgi:methionine salvage enolase-phosphatase E1